MNQPYHTIKPIPDEYTYRYTPVSQGTAKRMMDTQKDLAVVDVRTAQEYAKGHLHGAVLLPSGDIGPKSAQALLPDKGQTLLLYCQSGHRSRQAATKLANLGYTRVYDMGGIQNWPYDMVRLN